jgi:hypothetical protein
MGVQVDEHGRRRATLAGVSDCFAAKYLRLRRHLQSCASGLRRSLAWSGSTDNVGVTGYEVYRNGTLLATLGNVTSYADTLVAPLIPAADRRLLRL